MTNHRRPPRLIKARNAHVCVHCAYPIARGEEYIEQTGYWDGEAFRNRFHEECFEALRVDSNDDTFEFSPYSGEPPERLLRPAHPTSSPTPPASPDAQPRIEPGCTPT